MQGFNMGRYVPPEVEGKLSFNQASGKGHALGKRASKLKSEGILTVRFECPFAIWCTNCEPEQIIGQGVRFNAEKKKVGAYFSTPIWSFRFKHTACGKWIEVRTDPQSAEYLVVDGGRRRDTGGDKLLEGEEIIGGPRAALTEQEKERLEKEGGFAALEKKVEDKRVFLTQQQRIDELLQASDRDWSDPFEMSRRLRKDFRIGRRKRQADERTGDALKEKFGIGVDMLETKEEDQLKASLVEFGSGLAEDQVQASVSALSRPLFDAAAGSTGSAMNQGSNSVDRGKGGKKDKGREMTKAQALHNQLKSNTRAAADPFLTQTPGEDGRRRRNESRSVWRPPVKRKRSGDEDVAEVAEVGDQVVGDPKVTSKPGSGAEALTKPALVSYDSDSS